MERSGREGLLIATCSCDAEAKVASQSALLLRHHPSLPAVITIAAPMLLPCRRWMWMASESRRTVQATSWVQPCSWWRLAVSGGSLRPMQLGLLSSRLAPAWLHVAWVDMSLPLPGGCQRRCLVDASLPLPCLLAQACACCTPATTAASLTGTCRLPTCQTSAPTSSSSSPREPGLAGPLPACLHGP